MKEERKKETIDSVRKTRLGEKTLCAWPPTDASDGASGSTAARARRYNTKLTHYQIWPSSSLPMEFVRPRGMPRWKSFQELSDVACQKTMAYADARYSLGAFGRGERTRPGRETHDDSTTLFSSVYRGGTGRNFVCPLPTGRRPFGCIWTASTSAPISG